MHKSALFIISILLLLSACSVDVTQPNALSQSGYGNISVTEIENGLPQESIAVGFDVDDTVLFSSPAFYYVAFNLDGSDGFNKYGSKPFEQAQAWEDINNEFDKFSLPKKIASRLINMHLSRGDEIYFITARQPSANEQLSALLQRIFKIAEMNPVIFMGHKSKAEPIRKLNIQLYYGDSDSDIKEAQDAGARAIRVLRAANSTDPRKLNLGGFGESVLTDSDL